MLQRIHKHLIIEHGFIVTFLLFAHLRQEELLLHEGIVEFGIGVAELVILDEELKTLSQTRLAAVVLGKGRHRLRMLDDEGGIEALGFEETADQLVNESDGGSGVGTVHLMLLALLIKEDLRLL